VSRRLLTNGCADLSALDDNVYVKRVVITVTEAEEKVRRGWEFAVALRNTKLPEDEASANCAPLEKL